MWEGAVVVATVVFAGVAAHTSSAPPSVTGFSADVSGSARRPAPGLLAETPPRGPTIDGAEGVTSGVSYREGGRFFVRSLKRRGTCGVGAGVREVSGAPRAYLGRISGVSRLDCLHEVNHLHAGRVVRPGVRRQLAHTLDDLVGAQHLPRGGGGCKVAARVAQDLLRSRSGRSGANYCARSRSANLLSWRAPRARSRGAPGRRRGGARRKGEARASSRRGSARTYRA